jgi:hypothetical protein
VRGYARTLAVLVASALAAIALSGCIVISAVSTGQAGSMGPLQLTFEACAEGSPGCTGTSNSEVNIYELVGGETVEFQVLLAVRLPEGSTPPEGLTASLAGGGTLSFTRSPTYEAELQALEPAPAGERWWGWITGAVKYSKAAKQAFTVTIPVTLPRPADGGPLESPMHWRPVVGGRGVEGGKFPVDRPVRCGHENDDLYHGFEELEANSGFSVVCVDFPSAEATRGFLTAPLTDFGIVGSNVRVPAGGTGTAAFVAKRSGAADPSTVFSLGATTGVPGGDVSIDRKTVSLGGDAAQPVLATIDVPARTKPGSYPVTLTATAPGKPARAGTVTVTVSNKTPRIQSAKLSHKRFRVGGKRAEAGGGGAPVGTVLKVDLSEAAELSIGVARLGGKRPRTLGTSRRSLPSGKSRVRIRGRIGKVKLTPGRYRLTLIAKGDAGQASDPKRLGFAVVAG